MTRSRPNGCSSPTSGSSRYVDAIQALPAERRRSFLLHRLYGLSCAEIARRDGYSESAIKKHITLAMADIDAALSRGNAR